MAESDSGTGMSSSSGCYVLGIQDIDQTQVAVVGGKGAYLGSFRGSKASTYRPVTA